MPRVLIACEFSGAVRQAFRRRGIDAWSCDIIPGEPQSCFHMQRDVLELLKYRWDLLVCHPPCTYLTVSNNRAMTHGCREYTAEEGELLRQGAVDFFYQFVNTQCDRVCIENPIGIMSTLYRKPDQIIQPWMFGHPETKATCLWLKGLKPLVPTNIVEPDYMRNADGGYYRDKSGKRYSRIHFLSGRSPDRSKIRSITYLGIAEAMAAQWGPLL